MSTFSFIPNLFYRAVPTFVSFLQDIDSPYEVHEYVKMYLGDTPESSNFARQFLERRSRQRDQQRQQKEVVGLTLELLNIFLCVCNIVDVNSF